MSCRIPSGTGISSPPVIPSEFVPTRFANYVLANNAAIDRQKLFHQHTHLYLYNQMPGVYPLWFDEGLAVMMARAQFTGTKVEIFPAKQAVRAAGSPPQRVLRATKSSPEYLDQSQVLSFHFQSHAMVYRALIDEPEFGKQVTTYLEAFNNLATPDEAEAVLGNIADLDRKMRAFVNESGEESMSSWSGERRGPEVARRHADVEAGFPAGHCDHLPRRGNAPRPGARIARRGRR